jgi:hypothetical protein
MTAIPMPTATAPTAVAPMPTSTPMLPSAGPVPDAASRTGLEAAAMTLMANGMPGTAEPLFARLAASAPDAAMWSGRAMLARETWRADAIAREAVVPGFVPVPSAQRRADGAPRFVLLVDEARLATPEGASRFVSELNGSGVDAELRHYLDAALDDENGFIDWTPGEGYAVLAASTAPKTPAVVVACATASHRVGLQRSLALAEAEHRVTVRQAETASLDAIAADVSAPMLHVRAGTAADVPALMATGRDAVHAGRIASVLWSVPPATGLSGTAEQVAATVLSVLGFAHFTVVAGPDGAELALFEGAPSGQTLVVSLSPAYLAAHGAA